MNRLALDTSSTACSVAIEVDGDILVRHEEQAREHTRLLVPMVRALLVEAGISLHELHAVVLGNGPGSFIGMRIAASVAQGLAHAAGLPVIPVSSLAAVAMQVFAESDATTVAVAQDAHMEEVYFGLFQRDDPLFATAKQAERLQAIAVIDDLPTGTFAAGFGWQRYPELLRLNAARLEGHCDIHFPSARYLLPLAQSEHAIDPADVSPAYLRQKVAEKPAKSGG